MKEHPMYEQPDDFARLQNLLDASYERAGAHLRSIFIPKKRLAAQELARLLPGVQILSLATVTAAGEPRVAPVDGLFFRGEFWFGSDSESVRFRHIRRRPAVSADHIRGEELAILVHGTAQIVDHNAPEQSAFRDYCIETYGEGWNEWGMPAMYARIEAKTMFAHTLGNWVV
jgi:general stress protein 26